MKRIAILVAISLILGACLQMPSDSLPEQECARVRFVPAECVNAYDTKSGVSSTVETAVRNYNLMVYSGGALVSSCYVEGTSPAELMLVAGIPYNIYAVANAGKIDHPDKEESLWEYKYRIDDRGMVTQFSEDGFPMACVQKNVLFVKGDNSSGLQLERLVSKLHLKVDNSAIAGMGVASVRIRGCARSIQPFPGGERTGSRITSAADAVDGDMAVMKDLVQISFGREAVFYVPENCQGTLLLGNTDPWAKIPENLAEAELCTYVEVGCRIQDGFAVSGDVLYRMFLGRDNCSNFDVCGNTESVLELTTTKDLRHLSWKILPSISFEDGVASAVVTAGMHTAWDNQYIGEKVRVRLTLNPYLESFLEDILPECLIRAMDNENNPLGALSFGALERDESFLECDMTSDSALAAGSATLWLCYPDGTPICRVGTGEAPAVKKPLALVLNQDILAPGQTVLSQPIVRPMPEVGGKSVALKVYLLDSAGQNLNSSSQYGFSLLPYTGTDIVLKPRGGGSAAQIAATVSVSRQSGTECDDGPAVVYTLSSENDGSISSLNKALSSFVSGSELYDCTVPFPVTSNALTFSGGVNVLAPILVTASGDSFMSGSIDLVTSNTQTCLLVYNPSNMYIKGEYCFLGGGYHTSSVPPTTVVDTPVNFLLGCNDHHSEGDPWYGRKLPFELDPASELAEDLVSVNLSNLFRDAQQRAVAVSRYGSMVSFKRFVLSSFFGMSSMYRVSTQCSKLVDLTVRDYLSNAMDYYYEDLNGRYVLASGLVQAGDRSARWASGYKYLGGVGWGSTGRDVPAFAAGLCADYSPLNMDGLNSSPLRLAFRYDTATATAYLDISGNTNGQSIVYSITPQFYGERIWTKANYGGNEYAYFTYNATKIQNRITSESASIRLMTKAQMDNGFVYLNQNFWHESCGSVVNLPGNRYSALAMPTSMKFLIEIYVGDRDGRWVPYTSSVSNGPQLTISPTIYYRTAIGTYVQNSGVLPDGTSVGEHETASNVAVKYSDYFVYDESSRYTYTPTAEFVFPQQQVYYKVK